MPHRLRIEKRSDDFQFSRDKAADEPDRYPKGPPSTFFDRLEDLLAPIRGCYASEDARQAPPHAHVALPEKLLPFERREIRPFVRHSAIREPCRSQYPYQVEE